MIEIKRLHDKKTATPLVLENGYDESDFTEAYWMNPSETDGISRLTKDTSKVSAYLKDLFEIMGIGTVIDIGAGAGCLVNGLRNDGIKAHGCEYSSSGRKLAKEYFNINIVPCDLTKKLSFVDREFDYATCFGVLSMIPKDKMMFAISEIYRIVRKAVIVNVETRVLTFNEDIIGNPHHLTSMSVKEYRRMFTNYFQDATSLLPPQKAKYGIGVENEFCGIFIR